MKVIKPANGERVVTIGHGTLIQLGLFLGILGFVFSIAWWGATVNSKLDVVIGTVAAVDASEKETKKEVTSLSKDVIVLQRDVERLKSARP